MATKLVFGNFKGGVGKTTTSSVIAFLLQEQKRKTLYIDFDAQANATQLMYKTFNIAALEDPEYVSVFEAMKAKDLSKGIVEASPYLDFIPSGEDLASFQDLLKKDTRQTFLKDLISHIEDDYEFIIFDVPPTISEFNDNVFVACDYVIPVLQTAIFSAQGIPPYLTYVKGMKENKSLKVLGIIAYLVNKRDRIDKIVLEGSEDYIKELIFKSIIHNRARVKAYPEDGIQRNDFHDKRTLKMYEDLLKEILTKINQEEGN